MPGIFGLTLAKINSLWEVDVIDSQWDVAKDLVQHKTGGGLRTATGLEMPSGTFGSIQPKDKAFDWRSLKDFSIEIYDKETRSVVAFAASGCNWNNLGGGSDGAASVKRKIAWKGDTVVKV